MSLREKLTIKPEGLDFARRGYQPGRPEVRAVLGPHARSFVGGYNAMVLAASPAAALAKLDVPAAEKGFAVEGVAMGAVLLDLLTVARGRRTRELLAMEGDRYRHLIHFGAGFAISRLRWRGWLGLGSLDHSLRWLAYDGAGFSVVALGDDRRVRELGRHRFRCSPLCTIRHQGVGRAIWFIESADTDRVADRIATFPQHHYGDLWSGIAFAATLAGAISPDDARHLAARAGQYRPHLAQGAAFAAEVCEQAGHRLAGADQVAGILAGVPLPQAAALSAHARRELNGPGVAQHELWRERLRTELAGER